MTDDLRAEWDAAAATFDDAADHGLRDPDVRAAWQVLLAQLLPEAPSRVADIGCGTGSLSVLMAEMGHRVDGVDFAPATVERARVKAAGRADVGFRVGDAMMPPLMAGAYDAVLSRHVLWALPDPTSALERWCGLLAPAGRLVLIEGHWHTGAGLRASEVTALLGGLGRSATLLTLSDHPGLWGSATTDERFAVLSQSAASDTDPSQ